MNSGNSPASVARYVRQHGISWPVIVDPDRSFEKTCGVGEISLSNIWQARVINASGKTVRGNASDLNQTAATALQGAAWNVDPAKMTRELQAAWQQIEFGNFAPAASTVKRMLRSRKPDVKAAAELLNNYVTNKMQTLLDNAASADSGGMSWQAYKTLSRIEQQFRGYEIPRTVATDIERLEQSEEVKTQLTAWKKFELARRSAASRTATTRQRAFRSLQQIIDEYPDTDAATEAGKLIAAQ